MKTRAISLGLALLLLTASASLAVIKTKCTTGGRMLTFTAGSFSIGFNLLATKRTTDPDLLVFEAASGDLAAAALTFENQYEAMRFGPLPGVRYDLVLITFDGPASKCYLRGADDQDFYGPQEQSPWREIGDLATLAQTDAKYAKMLETVEFYRQVKTLKE
jgi:hypothetical protein